MSNIQYGAKTLYFPTGKIYLIGDVHNEALKLLDILDQLVLVLTPEDHIVFLGDLFDRGPHAALTAEVLINFARTYPEQVFFVIGNHDWMLQNYLTTGNRDWFKYLQGTLDNFKEVWNLPDIHQDTIAKTLLDKGFREITSRMIPYYETNEIVATHAPLDLITCMMHGIEHYEQDYSDRVNNPGFKHLLERMDWDILWMFSDENRVIPDLKKFRVCGHQPPPGKSKHPRLFKDRAFIDTGCGKGNRPLTCLVYPGKKYFQSET